jgi:hypothetical protein
MVENGVKLYGEADKFEHMAGTLLKYIHPPNTASVDQCAAAYRCAIGALAEVYLATVYTRGDFAGDVSRQRKNRTISVIRRLQAKFSKAAREELERHVWKG